MITKMHWKQFAYEVNLLREVLGYDSVTIHGRRVLGLKYAFREDGSIELPSIITSKQGEGVVIYTFEESLSDVNSLEDLHKIVKITNTDLLNIKSLARYLR